MVIVQRKGLIPRPKPVTSLLYAEGVTIVPAPLIRDHLPIPSVGLFADNKPSFAAQTILSLPATASVGIPLITFISSNELQLLRSTVHRTVLPPYAKPPILVMNAVALTIEPEPEITLQVPLPGAGSGAFKSLSNAQTVFSGTPKLTTTSLLITFKSAKVEQPEFKIVHR